MKRTLGAAVAVTVALVLAAAPPGALALNRANSKVEIDSAKLKSGSVKVKGTVSSPRKSCKDDRKVKVYHDVAPPGPGPEDFLLGSTRADEDGKWSFTTTFLPDRVYASVKKNRKCKGDVSKTEPVES